MAPKRFVATTVEVEGREETRIAEIPAFEPVPWSIETQLDIVGAVRAAHGRAGEGDR